MSNDADFRLLLVTVGGILVLKLIAMAWRRSSLSPGVLVVFLLAWPGVIPDRFQKRRQSQSIDSVPFLFAWARAAIGAASVILLAIFADRIPDWILGLAGTAAILLLVHLGIGDVLPWFLRWAGFDVPLLFDRPWAARSLSEFWSRRWNLAFIEMNQCLFLRRLYRLFGRSGSRFALFVLSGLLHELAISFPAGAGWGLPLGYFLLQGALVAIEKRFRIASRVWTLFWVIAPAPWLFHTQFRHAVILPFYKLLHGPIAHWTYGQYLSLALYVAAAGHLTVLIASFQVPHRLEWKEDTAKLTPFNRKIFWVYASYILFCIAGFSALTFCLHDALLAGDLAARYLAGFIAVFWTIRILADIFWYDPHDWPAGNALVAGHALLTTLFVSLATIYWFTALAPPR